MRVLLKNIMVYVQMPLLSYKLFAKCLVFERCTICACQY